MPVHRFMRKRPLVLSAIMLLLGAIMGGTGHVRPAVFGAMMVAFGVWFLLRRRFVTLFVMMLAVGAWGASAMATLAQAPPQPMAHLSGRVAQTPRTRDYGVQMTLDFVTLDGKKVDGQVQLYCYDEVEAHAGDSVLAWVETWHAQGQRNPGGTDFGALMRRRGIYLCATVKDHSLQVVEGSPLAPIRLVEETRRFIGERLALLYGEYAPLAQSMLIGDRQSMPEEMIEQFRLSGTAHLLAVSGLHVGCLAAALSWLLMALGVGKRRAYAITLPTIFLYVLLAGFSVSSMRAFLIFALAEGARFSGRPYDALTGLGAALILLVAMNPLAVSDWGFILSFGAIGGILLLAPTLDGLLGAERRTGAAKRLTRMMSMSIAAQLGMLPAGCMLFGTITPYSVLINLIAIPLGTALMPVLLISVPLSLIAPMAQVARWPGLMLMRLLTGLTAEVARWPGATIYAPHWPLVLVVAYALCVMLCSPHVKRSARGRYLTLLSLPILCGLSFALAHVAQPDGLAITFLDAGQADAAVVSADRRVYLIDVGDENGPADNYLLYTGRPVEGVFLTHPHSDHAGGLKELLSVRRVPVIYVPECWYDVEPDAGVHEAIELARARGSRVEFLKAGDRVRLSESVEVQVLAPESGAAPSDGNGASLMLRVVHGAGSALIAGDLPISAEPADIPRTSLVKASHHGAASATSNRLLRAASPGVVVISVGRNGYGHPSDALLDRLDAVGAAVFRTDRSGAITAHILRDGAIEMETFL